MSFKYGVKLPSRSQKIWLKEITSRIYRDLVKSLYNNDTTEFLQHLNNMIDYVYPGIIQEGLNVIDKVLILLHTRSICISADLKLKIKCPSTNKEFEQNIRLEDLISKLEKVNYNKVLDLDRTQVVHSIVKVKDEPHFIDATPDQLFVAQLASAIDTIRIDDKIISFKDLSFEERTSIIEKLPLSLSSQIFDSIVLVEAAIREIKLLSVTSPFTNDVVVDLPVSTDSKILFEFCKLIFNDDLGNLYKITFNLVSKAGFSAEYVESITPAEQLLYWTYYLAQAQKEHDEYSKASKSTNSNMPHFGSPVSESPSEFT